MSLRVSPMQHSTFSHLTWLQPETGLDQVDRVLVISEKVCSDLTESV